MVSDCSLFLLSIALIYYEKNEGVLERTIGLRCLGDSIISSREHPDLDQVRMLHSKPVL